MENRKSEPPDLNKCHFGNVGKAHSTLNVCSSDFPMTLSVTCPPSPAFSSITLTPGRIRNIDQDMETLRISRQDNPFLQQVIASRESLVESLEESESDDTNLMSQEFPTDLDVDPLTLPEIHEHMIRSPPPTTWPRSPNFRMFNFPVEEEQPTKGNGLKQHKDISWESQKGNSPPVSRGMPRLHHGHHERFSLLTPTPIRSLIDSGEDSIQLMSGDD